MLWGYECPRCFNWWSCMAPQELYRMITVFCPSCIAATMPEVSESQLDELIILESEQFRAERRIMADTA